MSKKHQKVCATLNYIDHFLVLGYTFTGCISISAFASLVVISIWTTSSVLGLKICTITASVKSITKKKKKIRNTTVLPVNYKLNRIEVLICKVLIDSVISHDEFVLIY